MTDERSPIRIHILHCGSMLVSKAVPYGGGVNLKNARRGVFDKAAERVELPVSAYLIEHPKGKVLIDTGWSREISPDGVYDAAAVKRQLPGYGFNEKAMLKSFDWIEEQANDPDCVAVIANHDPDVQPQVIEL